MTVKPRLRILLALSVALMAVAAVSAPVSAETTLIACNGVCGDYEIYDSSPPPPYGANCKYETASVDLDWISVRPPQMHGLATYPKDSRVQWRIRVLAAPDTLSGFGAIDTTPWQTAFANDQQVARAGHGFHRIRWYAPEDPEYYKVWLEMRWWKGGEVKGFASAEIDHYKWKWNGTTGDMGDDYCWPNIL
jgi:hypothetical protein